MDPDPEDEPEDFVWGSESEVSPTERGEVDELGDALWDDLEAFTGGSAESENDLSDVLGPREAFGGKP